MRAILFLAFMSLLVSCRKSEREGIQYLDSPQGKDWHIVVFESFQIDLPRVFKFQKQNSPDSFAGEFLNGEAVVSFDYGYFSQPFKGEAEYIKSRTWLSDVLFDADEQDTKVLDVWKNGKENNYWAKLQRKDSTWRVPIKIAETLKNVVIARDTVGGIARETSYNAHKHIKAVRLVPLKGYNKSMNAYIALVVTFQNIADDITVRNIAQSIKICKP